MTIELDTVEIGAAPMLDTRYIIERYEELTATIGNAGRLAEHDDEMRALRALLDELKGNGGDEQWRGDWYPSLLIREDEFTDYARELLIDCGDLPPKLPHYIAIDWEKTALNIRVDYFSVEFDGFTYWTR